MAIWQIFELKRKQYFILSKFLPDRGSHMFCHAAVPSFSVKLSCQSYKLSSAKLQASQFCSAKFPFLSCQAPISVLPSTHFCPAKLTNISRGRARPPRPPPKYAYECNHKLSSFQLFAVCRTSAHRLTLASACGEMDGEREEPESQTRTKVQMNKGWRYYLISKLILSSFIRTCTMLKNIFLEIFSQSCSLWTD